MRVDCALTAQAVPALQIAKLVFVPAKWMVRDVDETRLLDDGDGVGTAPVDMMFCRELDLVACDLELALANIVRKSMKDVFGASSEC
jgi:hypothetical protein